MNPPLTHPQPTKKQFPLQSSLRFSCLSRLPNYCKKISAQQGATSIGLVEVNIYDHILNLLSLKRGCPPLGRIQPVTSIIIIQLDYFRRTMGEEYPPGKFEAELEAVRQLMNIVHRARSRGEHPLTFIEETIRERQAHITATVQRNEDLRIRLDKFLEKIHKRNKEVLERASRTMTPDRLRRILEQIDATAAAVEVSPQNITPSACIKDEATIKRELCGD